MQNDEHPYAVTTPPHRGLLEIGVISVLLIFALWSLFTGRHLRDGADLIICVVLIGVTPFYLIRELFLVECLTVRPHTLTLEKAIFGRVISRRKMSTKHIDRIAFETWKTSRRGVVVEETGIRFRVDGRLVTCVTSRSELQGWEIIDKICRVTGLPSGENDGEGMIGPSFVQWKWFS